MENQEEGKKSTKKYSGIILAIVAILIVVAAILVYTFVIIGIKNLG